MCVCPCVCAYLCVQFDAGEGGSTGSGPNPNPPSLLHSTSTAAIGVIPFLLLHSPRFNCSARFTSTGTGTGASSATGGGGGEHLVCATAEQCTLAAKASLLIGTCVRA